jgi:hypothetical protein
MLERFYRVIGPPMWVVCVLFAGAGCRDLDVPEAPDMRPLEDLYESPTASFDTTLAQEASRAADSLLERARIIKNDDIIRALVQDAIQPSAEGAPEALGTLPVLADAVATARKPCPGWENDGTTSPGEIEVTFTANAGRISPVATGEYKQCKRTLTNLGVNLLIEGDIALQFRSTRRQSAVLLAFTGTVAINQADPLQVNASLRAFSDGAIEVLLPKNGEVVVLRNDGAQWTVFARNAIWTCDFERRFCTSTTSEAAIVW